MRASLLAISFLLFSVISFSQVINTFPTTEDLETWLICPDTCGSVCIFSGGWSNEGNINFLTHEGVTGTPLTGPSVDHNPGTVTGNYVYVESDFPCNPDTAILETPLIDLNNVLSPSFSFWYHQFGLLLTDSFYIESSIDSGNTWSFLQFTDSGSNNSLDAWQFQFVNLNAFVGTTLKLRIVMKTNSGFHDFALDDFTFDAIQNVDVGVDSVYSSTGYCAGDSNQICVNVTNFDTFTIDSVTVTVLINGAPFNSPLLYVNNLPPGATSTLCLGLTLLSNNDVLEAYTAGPNGLQDTIPGNDTSTFTVSIFALPTVDAGPDTTVCPLDSVVLGGNPSGPTGSSFNWAPAAFINNFLIGNPTAYYSAPGTYAYELQVVDSNGCTGSDSLYVTVTSVSTVDAGPDTTVCLGDSVVIGGAPTAPGSFSLLWNPTQFLNDDTLQNPTASIQATTNFLLQAQDTVGCFFYDTVVVSTFTNPQLNPGLSQSVCLGDTVVLGGTPVATNFQTITWSPVATLSSAVVANPTASPIDTTIYTVSILDTFGCSFSDSLQIVTVTPPTANAGVDTTICAFDSVVVGGNPTGSSGTSFAWSPSGLFNDTTLANPTISITQDTLLIVEVTDINAGCSIFDTVAFSIFPIPLADAGVNQEICLGDSVALGGAPTGSGTALFAWSPGNLLNDSTVANPQFIATDTAWVFLTVTDSLTGCTNQDSVFVIVNPLPTVEPGIDQSLCNGDTTGLGSGPTSATAVSYLWTPATSLDTATNANPFAFPLVTTVYTIVVTDSNGCQATDSTLIMVDTIPVPVISNPAPICFGDSAQLSVSGGVFYFWNPVGSLDNPSISNPKASPPTTTNYSVNVVDGNGCSDSVQVQLVVNPLPPVDAGMDQALCDGDTANLMATGATNYSWLPSSFLGNFNSGTTTAYPPIQLGYEVTGVDGNGCEAKDSVYVLVNFLPQVEAGPDVSVCLADSVQVGGSPTGPTGATFLWSPGAYVDATASNPNFIGGPVGTYFLYVDLIDINGCTSTDSLEVTVFDLPTATIAPVNDTLCVGDNVQLQGGGAASYSWTNSNINNANSATPTVFPPTTSIYTLTVTDGNGCTDTEDIQVNVFPLTPANAGANTGLCQQGSVSLQASGGVNYAWSPANGLSSTTVANPTTTTLIPRTYTVTVTDANGCSESDQVFVDVFPLPITSAGPDRALCEGLSVQIGSNPTGPAGSTFIWSPDASLNDPTLANPTASPLVSTIYRVTVTSDKGCSDSAAMTVTVNSLPNLQVLSQDAEICRNDSFDVLVTSGLSTYRWTPAQFVVNPRKANATLKPSNTTLFTVVGTDAQGCSSSADVTITVLDLPTVVVDVFPEEICEEDSTELEVSGGVLFRWSNGESLSDDSAQNPWAKPSVTSFYAVTVTDTNGCVNADSVEILVNPKPVANAGPDIENCDINVSTIGGTPTGPDGATYVWSPSNGLSSSFDPNPMVLDADRTVFTVEVQDVNGCTSKDSVMVNADCYERIYAPNAFTPGNNDLNDKFLISNYRIVDTKLRIYDRGGHLIFETSDLNIGWDGSFKDGNGDAPSGVYYWHLVYRTDESRKRETEGFVTLIR